MKSLTRSYSTYTRTLTKETINPHLVSSSYAVGGPVPQRALEIKRQLKQGQKFPFEKVVECYIGNPQYFGQKPISFTRDVLSLVLSPKNIESSPLHRDIKARAQYYINNIEGDIGAYSPKRGYPFVQTNVAQYIQQRDGLSNVNPDFIQLTSGSSDAAFLVLQALIRGKQDGVMIPIPQYPLYSCLIEYYNGTQIPYYLNEEKSWQITEEDLESSFQEQVKQGITPRLIVVINPGNPTGQVFSVETIEQIIKFSAKHKLVILADEVYQQNIYKPDSQFHSFRKIMSQLPPPYNQVELFSLYSVSKGYMGDCGIRGGYLEGHNIDKDAWREITKLKDVFNIPTVGEVTLDLTVAPPTLGRESEETVQLFEHEKAELLASLKRRAELCTDYLNKMVNVSCNPVDGALYAFAKLHFSNGVFEEAKKRNMHPDLLYCMEALEKTGVATVPGYGFGQKPGTNHFRTTTLVLPESSMIDAFKRFHKFNEWFHQEYKDSNAPKNISYNLNSASN